jgi:uncharacterized protein
MTRGVEEALLRRGEAIVFANRDDLLAKLDRLDRRVPARHEGRTQDDREQFCIVHYLRFLAGADRLPLPVTLRRTPEGKDPPDFVLEWPDRRPESLELTDGSTQEYQKRLSAESRNESGDLLLPVDINTPEKEAAQRWADILFSSFLRKARRLRLNLDHLVIYDLTGLGLLVPLELSAPILRRELQEWHAREKPAHRFGRVSVLRDQRLLLDAGGEGRILQAESPYFQIPVLRADNEDDLRRRLREIDRFCRQNSIRHLKAFGSILGDRGGDFREDSDLDLLVEFEPGARITLFDMARMELELSELIGFKVDLRTAGDLSRYFRDEVLQKALELPHAS